MKNLDPNLADCQFGARFFEIRQSASSSIWHGVSFDALFFLRKLAALLYGRP